MVKKSLLSTYDSIDDDDSTMTRPKTTRNSVVPSSRKNSGASAANSLRTAMTAARGGGGSGAGCAALRLRAGGRVVVTIGSLQVRAHRLGESGSAVRVVGELVHGCGGRREQHHVSRLGDGCGGTHGREHHSPSFVSRDLEHRDAGRVSFERLAQHRPVRADQ